MNDGQLKINETGNENSILSIEIKNKIFSVKTELSTQVNQGIELAKIEYTEINRLFDETTRSHTHALCFSQNLEDYITKIRILIALTPIFQRIQSYCDFVDNALLLPINDSLEKINSICDHKLDSEEAWEVVLPYLGNFVEDTAYLEMTKVELNNLYKYIQDKIEWFILSYKFASWQVKQNFFSALSEDPQILFWIRPWIEIAEEQKTDWETAMVQCMAPIPENYMLQTESRTYQ